MRKRIYRGAAYMLLALSIPAISWSLKENTNISNTQQTVSLKENKEVVKSDAVSAEVLYTNHITEIYDSAGLENASLDFAVFQKAVTGYFNLRGEFKVSPDKQVISIADFTKPSSEKRLWIVDLENHKLLFHTFVAHGRGSGGLMADKFSNQAESHQSSIGFYVTEDTYIGKHGLSLRLQGLDKGYNTNAHSRAIVVHGAEYVSQRFVNQNGYLGRSHGCPAVPVELTNDIIKTIKGRTALFINSSSAHSYASNFLNAETAINNFMSADQALAKL